MLVSSSAFLKSILTGMVAVAGELEGAIVKLFVNDKIPAASDVIGDYTDPTFDGYADSAAITYLAPYVDSEGNAEVVGDPKQFTCTGATVQDLVYGYVVESSGGALLWAERFDAPVPMGTAGDTLVILPRWSLGN